ncbi:hypothetical protein HU200_061076 [Digitaria exilis]|uniref:Uncharacterized protein n=1 Tax=Digitaria exilis TaxID=1010633 RepID=A0A835E105_9POAL|nr:hypothetical protein HU200_061076 [Digitaria exilis]
MGSSSFSGGGASATLRPASATTSSSATPSFLPPNWPTPRRFAAFLAPVGNKEERSPLFSAIFTMKKGRNNAVAFVFCSGDGEWRGTTYHSPRSAAMPTPLVAHWLLLKLAGAFNDDGPTTTAAWP